MLEDFGTGVEVVKEMAGAVDRGISRTIYAIGERPVRAVAEHYKAGIGLAFLANLFPEQAREVGTAFLDFGVAAIGAVGNVIGAAGTAINNFQVY